MEYLNRAECQENKAYVSIFGEASVPFGNEIIIKDDTLDAVDDGYSEFGGYGIRSGFISYNSMRISKPILISRELAMFRHANGVTLPVGDLDVPNYEAWLVQSNTDMNGKCILEVGCGTIPHANILSPFCRSYVAIDVNAGKIAEAMDIKIDNMIVAKMSGANMDFSDASFDDVYMFHCLHEVQLNEQGAILKEIHRVLKDKGRLFIIDAPSHPVSEFQQCFDIVHEQIMDYKHIFGVQHAEWVIEEYLNKGFFRETKNELHKMIFHFADIADISECITRSFMHEIEWTDSLRTRLAEMLESKYGKSSGSIDIEEVVVFRIFEKVFAR